MSSPDLSRFRLILQYDGSGFLGWQLQPRGRTVQGVVEDAIGRLTGARRRVHAAGRTDTGVHATGQAAAVSVPSSWTAGELRRALNAVLPDDVWVGEAHPAPMGFHPRFDAVARSYEYRIGLADEAFSPFNRGWCWALERDVDLDLLQRATELLIGSHSFGAFAKSGQEHRGDVCRVSKALWEPWEGLGVMLSISANRFLHHMVRYLVGTMVEIGWGRRPPDDLLGLLGGDDGSLVTSRPAPARGLFLSAVEFPPEKIRAPTDPEPTAGHSERITEDPNKRYI